MDKTFYAIGNSSTPVTTVTTTTVTTIVTPTPNVTYCGCCCCCCGPCSVNSSPWDSGSVARSGDIPLYVWLTIWTVLIGAVVCAFLYYIMKRTQ